MLRLPITRSMMHSLWRDLIARFPRRRQLIHLPQRALPGTCSRGKLPLTPHPIVDLNKSLLKEPTWMRQDGVHPSTMGNKIIASLVAQKIQLVLAGLTNSK